MKKGLGSRGGNIIRYTKGGNPVYGSPATPDSPTFSPQTKRVAKGIGIVAGSLAAAAVGGSVAGRIARKGADIQNKAHKLTQLAGKASNMGKRAKISRWAVQNDMLRQGFDKAHDVTRGGAAAVGTVGAVYGANKAIEGTSQDNAKNRTIASSAAVGAALFSVRLAEYHRLAPSLGHAVKVAAQKIRKPIKRGF